MLVFLEWKNKILTFLQTCPMASISTISADGIPQSAIIAFARTSNFEIIFETFYDTRKYANLAKNPHIALATGFSPTVHVTFQYEGMAIEMKTPEDIRWCKEQFKKKDTPCSDEFLEHPKVTFWKVKPTWLRYSDYTGPVPVIVEKVFTQDCEI